MPTLGKDGVDINDMFGKEEKSCLDFDGFFQVDDDDNNVCFMCLVVILLRPSAAADDTNIQNTTASMIG